MADYGEFGNARLQYLQEAYPRLYAKMVRNGTLESHLESVQRNAYEHYRELLDNFRESEEYNKVKDNPFEIVRREPVLTAIQRAENTYRMYSHDETMHDYVYVEPSDSYDCLYKYSPWERDSRDWGEVNMDESELRECAEQYFMQECLKTIKLVWDYTEMQEDDRFYNRESYYDVNGEWDEDILFDRGYDYSFQQVKLKEYESIVDDNFEEQLIDELFDMDDEECFEKFLYQCCCNASDEFMMRVYNALKENGCESYLETYEDFMGYAKSNKGRRYTWS